MRPARFVRADRRCIFERLVAAGQRLADPGDERVEAVAPDRARRLVALRERRVDHQFVADEQSERFEQDMAVALDPAERHRDTVETLTEAVLATAHCRQASAH